MAPFQVFVRRLTGFTRTFEVEEHTSVRQLKQMYEDREGIPFGQTRLIFAGRELEDARTMEDYNIQKESTVHALNNLTQFNFRS